MVGCFGTEASRDYMNLYILDAKCTLFSLPWQCLEGNLGFVALTKTSVYHDHLLPFHLHLFLSFTSVLSGK